MLNFFSSKIKKIIYHKTKIIKEEPNKEKKNVDGLIYSKCIENKQ